MIIVGAGGFAKEVLEIFHQKSKLKDLVFFDDVNQVGFFYEKFKILKNQEQVKKHFEVFDNSFTIAIGNPTLRIKLYEKFKSFGGRYVSSISQQATIGSYDVKIGAGTNILSGAVLSNSVLLGMGVIVYYNVVITHDCIVGDFVELSPNVQLLGRCRIGSNTQIGASSVILPDINVGKNVIIGSGSIITKDVPDNCVVVGNPGRIIRMFAD